MNESVNDKGVYRTAPATPGLLMMYATYLPKIYLKQVVTTLLSAHIRFKKLKTLFYSAKLARMYL